jgi:hypothetical protein
MQGLSADVRKDCSEIFSFLPVGILDFVDFNAGLGMI